MAADASVPNNFVPGNPSDADAVDANFAALVNWINTNAVHLDGSKAFSAVPSGPASDPSSDNQLARKAYVDARTPVATRTNVKVTRAASTSIGGSLSATITWTAEDADNGGFISVPGSTLTVPSGGTGLYAYGLRFDVDNSGSHQLVLSIAGSTFVTQTGITTAAGHIVPTGIVALKVGDVLTVNIKNGNGGAINVSNVTFYLTKLSD